MTISNFVAYVKQAWKNKPDTSTPLSAPRLLHMEDGIKMTSDAIEKIAAAVVSQIVNDPDKIASMAALYAVNQKIGDVANLPNGAADVVTAITQQNSNLNGLSFGYKASLGNGETAEFTCKSGSIFFLCRGVETDRAYILALDYWANNIARAVKLLAYDNSVATKYENGKLSITNNGDVGLSILYFLKK